MDMKSDDGNINKISCHHIYVGNPLNDKLNEYCIVYVQLWMNTELDTRRNKPIIDIMATEL